MQYATKVVDKENGFCKEYNIEVNPSNKQSELKEKTNQEGVKVSGESDPTLVVEIARAEYEHCVKRLDRFDNKVYILLTVCAFLFVMLTSAISEVGKIIIPQNLIEAIVVISYLGFMVYTIIQVIELLTGLISAISTIKLHRLDTGDILDFDMVKADKHKVAEYVVGIYENARQTSNDIIEAKYQALNKSVEKLIYVVSLLIVCTIAGCFVPHADDNEAALSDLFPVVADEINDIIEIDEMTIMND